MIDFCFEMNTGEYNTLCTLVKDYERELDRSVRERQTFEAQLDDIQRKMAAFVAQSKHDEHLPLSSSAVDKITEQFKVFIDFSMLYTIAFTRICYNSQI